MEVICTHQIFQVAQVEPPEFPALPTPPPAWPDALPSLSAIVPPHKVFVDLDDLAFRVAEVVDGDRVNEVPTELDGSGKAMCPGDDLVVALSVLHHSDRMKQAQHGHALGKFIYFGRIECPQSGGDALKVRRHGFDLHNLRVHRRALRLGSPKCSIKRWRCRSASASAGPWRTA